MAETKTYVAILDSIGYTDKDGHPVYATRGQEVDLTKEQADMLLDRDKHPPLGAIAEKGSELAAALAEAIPGHVNPDNARLHFAALAAKEGVELAIKVDPAGRASDEPQTKTDPSVAFSKLARTVDPTQPGAYDDMNAKDLRKAAKERGVEVAKGTKLEGEDRAKLIQQLQAADEAAANSTTATDVERSGSYA